jgi:hypothetical protein
MILGGYLGGGGGGWVAYFAAIFCLNLFFYFAWLLR